MNCSHIQRSNFPIYWLKQTRLLLCAWQTPSLNLSLTATSSYSTSIRSLKISICPWMNSLLSRLNLSDSVNHKNGSPQSMETKGLLWGRNYKKIHSNMILRKIRSGLDFLETYRKKASKEKYSWETSLIVIVSPLLSIYLIETSKSISQQTWSSRGFFQSIITFCSLNSHQS